MYVVQADALYLRPAETGVAYAIHDDKVQTPTFRGRLGARIHIEGPLFTTDNTIWIEGLHYHFRVRDSIAPHSIPTWGHPGLASPNFLAGGDSLWRLHLGLVDLGITHSWDISPSFCCNLFAFFRYAEIRHKLGIHYFFDDISQQNVRFSMKNKFWGLGPGGGVALFFFLHEKFSLYANGNLSATYGKFYIHQDQIKSEGKIKRKNQFSTLAPIVHTSLGMQWEPWHCFPLFIRFGVESYLYFSQNQLCRFVDQGMAGNCVLNQGDLSLLGLDLGLGICF